MSKRSPNSKWRCEPPCKCNNGGGKRCLRKVAYIQQAESIYIRWTRLLEKLELLDSLYYSSYDRRTIILEFLKRVTHENP